MNSYPEQQLLFAVWTQALKDLNKGFLLDYGVIELDDEEKIEEIRNNAQDAYNWIILCSGTFPIVAEALGKPVDFFQERSLQIIEENRQKIKRRSKHTTQFIYATVSRFRNYEKAFQKNFSQSLEKTDY